MMQDGTMTRCLSKGNIITLICHSAAVCNIAVPSTSTAYLIIYLIMYNYKRAVFPRHSRNKEA